MSSRAQARPLGLCGLRDKGDHAAPASDCAEHRWGLADREKQQKALIDDQVLLEGSEVKFKMDGEVGRKSRRVEKLGWKELGSEDVWAENPGLGPLDSSMFFPSSRAKGWLSSSCTTPGPASARTWRDLRLRWPGW